MSSSGRRFSTIATLSVALSITTMAGSSAMSAAAPDTTQSPASGSGWTKISTNTGLGLASAGLFRTSDGRLHVVWPRKDGVTFSLHYSTVAGKAKLVNSGTVLSKWAGVSAYPRIVPGSNGGLRLIFTGGNGKSGSPYNLGAVYSATSRSGGATWALAHGSLSHSIIVPLTDDAAVTKANGTPVAGWAAGTAFDYHVGISSATPAANPDQSIGIGHGVVVGPTMVRDKNGSVWVAWYTSSGLANQGYWVDQIMPTRKAKVKAPGSGGKNMADNQPRGPVAFTARVGGGEYLAYCVPVKYVLCGHVALWKVGATKAVTVPGSSTGHVQHVAIAAGPGGHLWLMWFDIGLNRLRVVRTNAAVTKFGPVRTFPLPPKLDQYNGLQIESSKGPADVIALVQQNVSGASPAYWDRQLYPALSLRGSRSVISHSSATTITFRVTDTGNAVPGAKVTLLGKHAFTNSKGVAKITVSKGASKGKHKAIASKPGYSTASFTVTVT